MTTAVTLTKHLLQYGIAIRQFRELATKAAVKSTDKKSPVSKKEKYSQAYGLDKKEKRKLKNRLLEDNENLPKQHIFKELYPWKTKAALAEELKKSEVYNKDGLIALCKPYGIAQVKVDGAAQGGNQTIIQGLNSGGLIIQTPSLKDVLPNLQEMYGTEHLEIVKTTERWTSGLLLLSTKKKVTEQVQKALRRSKAFKRPALTFWAITNGLPRPENANVKVAIGLSYVNDIGKVPMIMKNYTRDAIDRGDMKLVQVKHSTLVHNDENGTSLVEVNIQTVKWHFLRVWLAQAYSPVLGDAVYGGRVKTIAGKKIQISPQNMTAYQPQEICSQIYKELELSAENPEVIPSLIHLNKIRLAQFNRDKSDLVLSVPPPTHFVLACKKLGLDLCDVQEMQSDKGALLQ